MKTRDLKEGEDGQCCGEGGCTGPPPGRPPSPTGIWYNGEPVSCEELERWRKNASADVKEETVSDSSAPNGYVTVRLTRTQAEVCVISLETDLESLDRDHAADLFGSRNAADAGWRALEALHRALGHDMVMAKQPKEVTE